MSMEQQIVAALRQQLLDEFPEMCVLSLDELHAVVAARIFSSGIDAELCDTVLE